MPGKDLCKTLSWCFQCHNCTCFYKIFLWQKLAIIPKFFHFRTDYYPNIRNKNWKTLTTEELNIRKTRAICWYTNTHPSIVLGSVKFPRNNFQLNLTCFHMEAKKGFWKLVGGQWFYHTSSNLTLEKNICIC